MELGIFCNFSYPHIGGSEIVIKNISERLVKFYNYHVNIYSYSVKSPFCENGVQYFSCAKGIWLIPQINENDHVWVYSDSFWGFNTIVDNIYRIVPEVSVTLVGAYYMRSHPDVYDSYLKAYKRFGTLVHSAGDDYKWAMSYGLFPMIIPNGVDLQEFSTNNVNFREKYQIKEKYVLLNVSNYFYGKGQEILPQISRKLVKELEDFVILSVSSSVEYSYDKLFLDRCKKMSEGQNIRFLRDLSREDVIAAFKSADVFVCTSKKETGPLVTMESRAAGVPYVSMKVGDIEEQNGGIPILFSKTDEKGYAVVEEKVINHYVSAIVHLLKLDHLRTKVLEEGRKDIDKIDWSHIVPLYDRFFSNG